MADPDVERTIADLQELARRIRALSPDQRAFLLSSISDDETVVSPAPGSDPAENPGPTPPP